MRQVLKVNKWPEPERKNIVDRCIVLYEGNDITTDMLPASNAKSEPEFSRIFKWIHKRVFTHSGRV